MVHPTYDVRMNALVNRRASYIRCTDHGRFSAKYDRRGYKMYTNMNKNIAQAHWTKFTSMSSPYIKKYALQYTSECKHTRTRMQTCFRTGTNRHLAMFHNSEGNLTLPLGMIYAAHAGAVGSSYIQYLLMYLHVAQAHWTKFTY